jgi:hypothetical protein
MTELAAATRSLVVERAASAGKDLAHPYSRPADREVTDGERLPTGRRS